MIDGRKTGSQAERDGERGRRKLERDGGKLRGGKIYLRRRIIKQPSFQMVSVKTWDQTSFS